MADVVALGELLIDFVGHRTDENQYPTLTAKPGGAPANYLAALEKFGCDTSMIAKVGDDMFGHLLVHTMEEIGVGTQNIIKDPNVFTTLAFVTLDDDGDREFSFARKPGADTCLTADEIDYTLIDEAKVFHFGSLSLTNEPVRAATQRAVSRARNANTAISFDPNLRLPLWENAEAARMQINWGLHQADVVKIGADEVDFMWGIGPEAGAEKLLTTYDVKLVYITMGARGCLFATDHCFGTVTNPLGIKVLDTTGAGDIFGGAAMSRLLKIPKYIKDIDSDDLINVCRFACCAAALSTQTHGGIDSVPSKEEVEALMNVNY